MKASVRTVLFVSFEANLKYPGAQTSHTFELAKALSINGRKIIVITSGREKLKNSKNMLHITADKHEFSGSFPKKLNAVLWKNINFYRHAKKHIKHVDAIYERHNTIGITGLLLAWRYKKPLYYEVNSLNAEEALYVHKINSQYLSKLFNRWLRFQLNKARAVIVQTSELQALVKSIYRLHNVAVIPNGAEITAKNSNDYGNRQILRCVYVGAIDNYHSLDSVIEVFSSLKNVAHLTIIGGGSRLPYLKSIYASKTNIIFSGKLKHHAVLSQLGDFNIGIAPYNLDAPLFRKYGFYFCPMKLIEYSAAAIPTLMIGGSNSLVRQFEDADACIVLKKPIELKGELKYLYNNPKVINNMSQKALAIATHFTWNHAAKSTLEVLDA